MRKLYLLICSILIALGTTQLRADDVSSGGGSVKGDGGHSGLTNSSEEADLSSLRPREAPPQGAPVALEDLKSLQSTVNAVTEGTRGVSSVRATGEVTEAAPIPEY